MLNADAAMGKEVNQSSSPGEFQFSAITATGIIARLHRGEPTAEEDCAHTYGAYVSELAKYNTLSDDDADAAAAKIFDDIHAFARSEHAASLRKPEIEIIRQIAVSRIVKQLWDKRKVV